MTQNGQPRDRQVVETLKKKYSQAEDIDEDVNANYRIDDDHLYTFQNTEKETVQVFCEDATRR